MIIPKISNTQPFLPFWPLSGCGTRHLSLGYFLVSSPLVSPSPIHSLYCHSCGLFKFTSLSHSLLNLLSQGSVHWIVALPLVLNVLHGSAPLRDSSFWLPTHQAPVNSQCYFVCFIWKILLFFQASLAFFPHLSNVPSKLHTSPIGSLSQYILPL